MKKYKKVPENEFSVLPSDSVPKRRLPLEPGGGMPSEGPAFRQASVAFLIRQFDSSMEQVSRILDWLERPKLSGKDRNHLLNALVLTTECGRGALDGLVFWGVVPSPEEDQGT
jgi:hypothetical protein